MVMFDSLNRQFLPPYGNVDIPLPNFDRLASRTVTFDRCYAGSMPCMPARRELHTGRYNFLHCGWGPLEPFDDSVPEMLKRSGIHTHLVTDHYHYWEDGGATYHNRYNTYEFIRGQEGDPWKGEVEDPDIPEVVSWKKGRLWRQDWVNRKYTDNLADHTQTRTFDAGLEFLRTNRGEDNWFLQIECFDPHEPFNSTDEHHVRVGDDWQGPHYEWPDYRPVVEDDATVAHLRNSYSALLTMCDDSLGRVLDTMDEYGLWEDTLLIVCTDHGFLLGERGWYGKNVQPWYEETIHTPLFLWDPRRGMAGTRSDALVQTIDWGPTLLDAFDLPRTRDMQGHSLGLALDGKPVRDTALFGVFGGHVSITDGHYVYMRACHDASNAPLEEYTLMPTRMDSRMSAGELDNLELCAPMPFTKGMRMLKVPGWAMSSPYDFGTLLFDLQTDPGQTDPLRDNALELKMIDLLLDALRSCDAPASQFKRLGLPIIGRAGTAHLLCDAQWWRGKQTRECNWREAPISSFSEAVRQPISDLKPETRNLLAREFRAPLDPLMDRYAHLSIWHIAVMLPAMTPARLHELDDRLSDAG